MFDRQQGAATGLSRDEELRGTLVNAHLCLQAQWGGSLPAAPAGAQCSISHGLVWCCVGPEARLSA